MTTTTRGFCKVCGAPLASRRRTYCPAHRPATIFEEPARYGTYVGESGDAASWRAAFQARFTAAEVQEYLGDRTPWDVLGIGAGSDPETIRRAYRQRAMETHPDRNPGLDRALFQAVQAAYQSLTP